MNAYPRICYGASIIYRFASSKTLRNKFETPAAVNHQVSVRWQRFKQCEGTSVLAFGRMSSAGQLKVAKAQSSRVEKTDAFNH